ncbi:telomere-associated protein RIF1-like isoform X2 [Mya arenaria]|nr:telomere-associated protein RIF1-like isoform X2 [Mya arenaria]
MDLIQLEGTDIKARKECYAKFNKHFKETAYTDPDRQTVKAFIEAAASDIQTTDSTEALFEAVQSLIICLNSENMVIVLDQEDCSHILKALCMAVPRTSDKTCTQRALFCLATQKLPDSTVQSKVEDILSSVTLAMEKWRGQSMTVENECLNVVDRLLKQAENETITKTREWGGIVVPLLTHAAIKVREHAIQVITANLEHLILCQRQLTADLKMTIKQMIVPNLKRLFNDGQQLYVLKCWGILVQMLGKELHSSSQLNELLPVVELGFKCISPDVKVAAFHAWQHLIDNFSLSQAVIHDPKRIKLCMQVFNHNNTKTEPVAMAKLKVWWHFIWLLGNKFSTYFDMVGVPFLRFCIGGTTVAQKGPGSTPKMLPNGGSPATPHLKLTSPGHTHLPVFSRLQLLGIEALAHFFGNPGNEAFQTELDALQHEVVTGPSFFIKHSSILISMATELFNSQGASCPDGLVSHIWQWIVAHFKNAVDSPVKLDIRDTLKTILLKFQLVVLSRNLDNSLVLAMFKSLCTISKKVMSSTAYNIQSGETVNGTPAMFLISLLLTPNLLQSSATSTLYHQLFSSLLTVGASPAAMLDFLQSVLDVMVGSCLLEVNKEAVCKLWSAVVSPLLEHISKTSEVNQGDSVEHNFSCCVTALTFPVAQSLHNSPQSAVKSLLKTWTDLYSTVSRLASLVTSARANTVCEEICAAYLEIFSKQESMDWGEMDMTVQMCVVMTSNLDFSNVDNQVAFNLGQHIWGHKRVHVLENFNSLVCLLALLQKQALTKATESDAVKKLQCGGIQGSLNGLIDCFSTIFKSMTSCIVILNLIGHLAQPIGDLFSEASKKTTVKVFNNSFQQKLESLWMDICTCIQGRYSGLVDSEFLHKLSPLLEATFLHSRRQIKNQTLALWSSLFSKASELDYPVSLKPILTKVKTKSSIKLPGFIPMEPAVIEETPVSQMTQGATPEPHLPGMPSPHKIMRGSFLNKPVSPRPSKSPIKTPHSPRAAGSAKKKVLSLDGFDEGEFVAIKYSPKKMVLTEHQKDVLKERHALPTVYNSLENSVDASLMAAHFSTDTQMEVSNSSTPTPTTNISQPFSLFGSMVPPTLETNKLNSMSPSSATSKKGKRKTAKDSKGKSQDKTTDGALATKKKYEDSNLSSSGLRRSVRFRESKQDDSQESNTVNEVGPKEKSEKRMKLSENKLDKEGKQEEPTKTFGEAKQDSYVVIEESEQMDVDDLDNENVNNDKRKDEQNNVNVLNVLNPESKGDEVKISQVDLTKDSQEMETQPPADMTVEATANEVRSFVDKSDSKCEISDEKCESSGDKGESSGERSWSSCSVPQNVLGVALYTQISSSKTSESKSDESVPSSDAKTIDSEDKNFENSSCETETQEKEKTSSDPLLSWCQKLTELSQSPKIISPMKRFAMQEITSSPMSRAKSPLKSPRRNKKKTNDENETKGALDKWVIRSPVKGLGLFEKPGKIITVGHVSQTLVEETQSPTKFSKVKEKNSDGLSPSVMETPPKSVLETIPVNLGNSSRKLFGSQYCNADFDIVGDSNIVPASPNSKSFTLKTGTPVIKIRKLTDDDIRLYSPSRNDTENDKGTPQKKRAKKEPDSVKKLDFFQVDKKQNQADFLSFKELDNNVFPDDESDFEDEMLKLTTGQLQEKESVNGESEDPFASSQELFSQDSNVDDTNIVKMTDFDTIGSVGNEVEEEKNCEEVLDTQATSQDDLAKTNSSQTETPRRKGRSRKQVTPKKMTPEDSKQSKKKKGAVEDVGCANKVSARIKKMKERVDKSSEDKQDKNKETNETVVYDKERENFKEDDITSPNRNEKTSKSRSDKFKTKAKTGMGMERDNNPMKVVDGETEAIESLRGQELSSSSYDKDMESDIKSDETMEVQRGQTTLKMKEKKNTRDNKKLNAEDVTKEESNKALSLRKSDGDQYKTSNTQNECCRDEENIPEENSNGIGIDDKVSKELRTTEEFMEVDTPEKTVLEHTGEQTPETKSGLERSATKHKKEVAQKVANKRLKDVVVIDSDSNLDTGDELPELEQVVLFVGKGLPSSRKLYNASNEKVADSPEMQVEKNNDSTSHNIACSDLDDSEDDIPIQQLKENVMEAYSNNKDRKSNTPLITGKLRSSSLKKAKFKSGDKKSKTSPIAKKAINLALKRTKNNNKKKLNVEIAVSADVTDKKADEIIVQTDGVDGNSTKTHSFSSMSKDDLELGLTDLEKMIETPEKDKTCTKGVADPFQVALYSDSKLLIRGRRFQKRGMARRSILKIGSMGSTDECLSPVRTTAFHPITVRTIHSPTASPSASILKRKRLIDDPGSDTNSPPTK